ncbi:hypothetical protein Trydic_g2676 [Trypoxylus dichotomus]
MRPSLSADIRLSSSPPPLLRFCTPPTNDGYDAVCARLATPWVAVLTAVSLQLAVERARQSVRNALRRRTHTNARTKVLYTARALS